MFLTSVANGALVSVFALAVVAGSMSQRDAKALITRLTGTWKEDISQRKVDASVLNLLRFQRTPDGQLEEIRGTEKQPLTQPVIFDGKPREVPSGNSIAWRQLGPNAFERVLSKGSETLATRRITIAADGKSLTEVTETKQTDGTAKAEIRYERVSGNEQGLVGVWRPASLASASPGSITFEPAGENAIRVTFLTGASYEVPLNGKQTPISGPRVGLNASVAARPLNDNALEVVNAQNGAETEKSVYTVSEDGKTITLTVTNVGSKTAKGQGVIVLLKQ